MHNTMNERNTQLLLVVCLLLLAIQIAITHRAPLPVEAKKGDDVTDVVRARAIELVDDAGRAHVSLMMEENGQSVFRMFDSSGAIRLKIGASSDGSGLLLLDDRTEPAVHILAGHAGTSLTLVERGKEKRILAP